MGDMGSPKVPITRVPPLHLLGILVLVFTDRIEGDITGGFLVRILRAQIEDLFIGLSVRLLLRICLQLVKPSSSSPVDV